MFAWLLAALWLPASLHCAAESAGLFDEVDCCGHAEVPLSDDSAQLDHCETLAAGALREDLAPNVAVLPPSELPLLLGLIEASGVGCESGTMPRTEAPRHVVAGWMLARRVVAPAQAP